MSRGLRLSAVVVFVLSSVGSSEDPWEWAGVFRFYVAGHYTWNAARNDGGVYADSSMKLVIVPATSGDDAGLHAVEDSAETLWNGAVTTVQSGSELETDGKAYTLQFNAHTWMSYYVLHVDTPGFYAVFAQHKPTEFENGFHYLKAEHGADVEPVFVESGGAHGDHSAENQDTAASAAVAAPVAIVAAPQHDDQWGAVLAGSFLTCVPALFGVFFLAPAMGPNIKTSLQKAASVINSFASGVILACAVFLLLPEAVYLCGSGQSEATAAATWGTSILAGWFTCMLVHHAAEVSGGDSCDGTASDTVVSVQDAEAGKDDVALEDVAISFHSRLAIIIPVLVGDLFHNFADGLVLGVAFKTCGGTFGWELVGVTIAHEAPQELADLCILIMEAKMTWYWATLANFVFSCSTIIGAIITYSLDIDSNMEGCILAYGAGVYIFVACTELGPRIVKPRRGMSKPVSSALQLSAYAFGCLCMGLILINHEHCMPPPEIAADGTVIEPVDPHAGHNHRI